MEDTMKPEFQDPIEVECSKLSASMLAPSYCATVISNLEGWKNMMYHPSSKEHRSLKVEKLDLRVRRLENMEGIHPPPPMDRPSWDSLTWRVARLHRKMPVGPPNRLCGAPPCITPSLDLLESVTASLSGIGVLSWVTFKGKDSLEGDALIHTAAQFLCYTAGQRRLKVVGSFDLQQNCKLALDLSLDSSANGPFPPVMPFPGPPAPVVHVRPPPPPVPMKSCCGCCNCSCHKSTKDRHGVLSWMTRKYHEEKHAKRTGVKARIASAFRKLAFWRRGSDDDTDSDVSSITTRTSSTLD
ncbi:hypothetical protein F5Y08DRAFT_307709 [Xylaria arbuscula]|nr:hypothetical protein F5Y08DRAFT_307709 [Xylaria arbuscula]